MSEWIDMFHGGLLFQWGNPIKIELNVLVWYKSDIIIISSNVTCFRHDIPEKNWSFGVKQKSLTHPFTINKIYYEPFKIQTIDKKWHTHCDWYVNQTKVHKKPEMLAMKKKLVKNINSWIQFSCNNFIEF